MKRRDSWRVILGAALAGATSAAQDSGALRRSRVDMIFSSSLFSAANRNEATAAIRLWGNTVARKRGFLMSSTVQILDGPAAIRKSLQAGACGILGMDAVEYLKLADIASIEPIFNAVPDATGSLCYLLLARADSGITALEGARGKNVLVYAAIGANLGQLWVESLLLDGRLGRPEHFFGSVESVSKPSSAILPVFFGKADLAIVEQGAFDVAREMNPQVGARLQVLATSPKLIAGVICVSRTFGISRRIHSKHAGAASGRGGKADSDGLSYGPPAKPRPDRFGSGARVVPEAHATDRRECGNRSCSMSWKRDSVRFLNSIVVRIAAACWVVTLLTLAVYVMANLPQQKKDLLDALESKAQGVSSSLQDITAGAAMSEDYSTVVEHCIQVLRGDEAIEYLVITKTDGFSVIVDRQGWHTATLDRFWRPSGRKLVAEVAYVPLVGKRVFHYSRPFDYSAIRWGWVNVGLSMAAYDRSVARIHERAALLAVLGAAMSLLISFGQARRLVKPIFVLQSAVGQLARGDLSARANLHSGDEVEELAKSFNTMAGTILERDRVLESVRFAGQQLLSAEDWTGIADEVLAKIGSAADVSRVRLFANRTAPDGVIESAILFQWTAGMPERSALSALRWSGPGMSEWGRRLAAGEECVADSWAAAFEAIGEGSPRAAILVPIQVGGAWWGILGLAETSRDRTWGEAEKDSLRAVAGMFGAAITRQGAQQALLEAKNHLELRVLDRTRELQAEVQAKRDANARLAEAQQRLIGLSRRAGMAEVATGVLHNVGNVLNSVNVSATIVANKIRESRVSSLLALTTMLQEHSGELGEFLTRDPKGQRVVPYLVKLSTHLEEERQVMFKELDQLAGHVGHIKEIVATQQNYAKMSGLIEVVSLADLVEDVLHMVGSGLERHAIQLERDFEPVKPVAVDKHLVLQILLNLLRNAKQAITEAHCAERRIRIRIHAAGDERIRVSVSDTGVGLPPENLTRIFSHGFTTRRDGHGFGLHSGANAAQQMGGSLWAESEGVGRGATFILELPLTGKRQTRGKQLV